MNQENDKDLKKSLEINREQFGREAEKYSVSKIHSNQEDLNYSLSIINPRDDWQCLDIATGAGHLAHILAQHTKHVIASDLTSEMLLEVEKLAQKKDISNITFEEFDVHSIPHEDNKFDLVMSRI